MENVEKHCYNLLNYGTYAIFEGKVVPVPQMSNQPHHYTAVSSQIHVPGTLWTRWVSF